MTDPVHNRAEGWSVTAEELVAANWDLPQTAVLQVGRGVLDDDLLSAACLALWRAAESYDPAIGSFRGWAALKIRFAVAGELRHLFRSRSPVYQGRPVSLTAGDAAALAATGPTPESAVVADLSYARLVELVGSLPGRRGEAARMRWLEGATFRAIGDRLGISESAACQLVAAAGRNVGRRLRSEAA